MSMAVISVISSYCVAAQVVGYSVSGRVIDRLTREGIPYAAVLIVGLEGSGVAADSTGVFTLNDVKPGIVDGIYREVLNPEKLMNEQLIVSGQSFVNVNALLRVSPAKK